ncbi:MAG: hypothetical protein C0625_07145 [Arcobacter sp.]|nr:MAG: hypothetical protein C0625_07145 [Arcobacter sp.]
MYKYIFLILIVFFAGCTNKSTNIEKVAQKENNYTFKNYTNISKDAIFEAAKKVFILAGKKHYRIDSYRDHLVVSKTKMSHFPLYAVTHEDIWDLQIDEKDNTSFAKLDLIRITDFYKEKPEYLSKRYHELFWNRVEYLLGLNDKWTSCTSTIDINNALCDSIDMYDYKNATKDDLIKDILIVNRKKSRNVDDINDDILKEDEVFTFDEKKNDILENEDNINEQTTAEKKLDDALGKEIEELDRKVNSNIDETLDKIENNIKDEEILDEKK